MEKHFVTYEIALKLKELGFGEDCLACFMKNGELYYGHMNIHYCNNMNRTLSPLWQQAIDWFRKKHNINITIPTDYDGSFIITFYDMNEPKKVNKSYYQFNDYDLAREQSILKSIELCKK